MNISLFNFLVEKSYQNNILNNINTIGPFSLWTAQVYSISFPKTIILFTLLVGTKNRVGSSGEFGRRCPKMRGLWGRDRGLLWRFEICCMSSNGMLHLLSFLSISSHRLTSFTNLRWKALTSGFNWWENYHTIKSIVSFNKNNSFNLFVQKILNSNIDTLGGQGVEIKCK